jgi:hypothetical protein
MTIVACTTPVTAQLDQTLAAGGLLVVHRCELRHAAGAS